MKKSEFDNILELSYTGGFLFAPVNQNAFDLCNSMGIGESALFGLKTPRDYKFHQCYFVLINFIWGYMPNSFQSKIPKKHFHNWLKILKGDYEEVFTFANGVKLIEYESIAFGNMSQERFENYIREQLPWIYENVIGAYYKDEKYNSILETIESEFEKFLSKL